MVRLNWNICTQEPAYEDLPLACCCGRCCCCLPKLRVTCTNDETNCYPCLKNEWLINALNRNFSLLSEVQSNSKTKKQEPSNICISLQSQRERLHMEFVAFMLFHTELIFTYLRNSVRAVQSSSSVQKKKSKASSLAKHKIVSDSY